MTRLTLVLAVLFLVAVPAALWAAAGPQTTTYAAVLSGKVVPLTVTFKNLDSSWRRFTPTGAQEASSPFSAIYGISSSAFYTKGQTVSVQGEVYLVAYSAALKTDMSAMIVSRGRSAPEPLTADSVLQLSLLNVRGMGSMTNIKPFDLKAELAAFAEASASMQRMISSSGEEGGEGGGPDANLKQVALALEMYITDYDAFPTMTDPAQVRATLSDYVSDEKVFKDQSGEYYSFNTSLSGKSTKDLGDLAKVLMAFQAAPDKDGKRAVAFADGSVKTLSDEDWKKLAGEAGILPAPMG